MKTFEVVWRIDIDAETPEAAARQARAIQLDHDNIATWFEVRPATKKVIVNVIEAEVPND